MNKLKRNKSVNDFAAEFRFSMLAIYTVPMFVIAYIYIQYIYPMLSAGDGGRAMGVMAVLILAVILSMLGLAHLSKTFKREGDTLLRLDERMRVFLNATKRFEEMGYSDLLTDSIAESAREVLDAESSSLLLFDKEGLLRFEYVEGSKAAACSMKGKTLQPGQGVAGWTAREMRPIIVNDVKSDPRFDEKFDKDCGFTTRSVMCAPLIFAGRNFGVLEVINKLNGLSFSENDLKTLVSLSDRAASAIHRVRMEEEMKSDFVHVFDMLLIALENIMPEKKGHSRRVSRYAVKIAKGLGLGEEDVRKVYFGALLHDVGFLKFDIVENQLKGKYKFHPQIGADMVKNISQWKDIVPIIRDHHEHYDGSGYPAGLKGSDISLGARIVGLAEAFDAMTSPNSYKPAVSFEDAIKEISAASGKQFDPEAVDILIRSFRKEDLTES
ncbi:MAG: HD domain-containing phosphohydrolase [Nitrospirota bacterium]